jgi:hypothetical protein
MRVPGWIVATSVVAWACAGGACASTGSGLAYVASDGGDDASGDGGDGLGPAIYVSTTGSDLAMGTSPSDAVQTIGNGITLATSCLGGPCVVKIAEGHYAEALKLVGGVSLYGGYSTDFSMRDAANHAVIVESSNFEPTVVASGLLSATTVDGVTVQGPDLTTADGGQVSVALSIASSGTQLVVSNATVVGGTGAQGAVGATGPNNTCTAAGGQGGVATDCDSANGTGGLAGGDPINGGDGGAGGSNDCPSACPLVGSEGVSDGTGGTAGGNGSPGAGGTPATDTVGSFATGSWVGSTGGPGASGTNGTG